MELSIKELDTSEITLTPEQQAIKDAVINTSDNFFITGKAGTGKSTLLQELKKDLDKRYVVTAPTGIAALNIKGQTIHSLFGIKPSYCGGQVLKTNTKVIDFFSTVQAIIIDEVSMVRADILDAIDEILRKAKKVDTAFGGVQMIMFGDVYQLAPIISDKKIKQYFKQYYEGPHFFNAHLWDETSLTIKELTTIHRQKDEKFVSILNNIREGEPTEEDLFILNCKIKDLKPSESKGFITLALTNQAVSFINQQNLDMLDGPVSYMEASVEGEFEPSSYPTEYRLELKEGAAIMMLRNDRERRWVNGSLGIVHAIEPESIYVEFHDGKVHPVTLESWEKIRYVFDKKTGTISTQVTGSFTQYPMKLAWAITSHKSQGQTFDKMILDVGRGAFAHGQTYVALSRCTNLENLYLTNAITPSDIIVDPLVKEFAQDPSSLL